MRYLSKVAYFNILHLNMSPLSVAETGFHFRGEGAYRGADTARDTPSQHPTEGGGVQGRGCLEKILIFYS